MVSITNCGLDHTWLSPLDPQTVFKRCNAFFCCLCLAHWGLGHGSLPCDSGIVFARLQQQQKCKLCTCSYWQTSCLVHPPQRRSIVILIFQLDETWYSNVLEHCSKGDKLHFCETYVCGLLLYFSLSQFQFQCNLTIIPKIINHKINWIVSWKLQLSITQYSIHSQGLVWTS